MLKSRIRGTGSHQVGSTATMKLLSRRMEIECFKIRCDLNELIEGLEQISREMELEFQI